MESLNDQIRLLHNKRAPYWAVLLFLLLLTGLLTIWFNLGVFWKGYVLDIVGPAWNYILFRGLFTSYSDNKWRHFFTPLRTFVLFIGVCLFIELLQYFKIYDGLYYPWDFMAYISLLLPLFLVDVILSRKLKRGDNSLRE